MGFLGGEKALGGGRISGFLPPSEKLFVGAAGSWGEALVRRVWAETETGPFKQCKADSL